ncbi:pentatricopeptide repeat-containing protein At1g77170, mitochondrial-like [Wolffia australiana]
MHDRWFPSRMASENQLQIAMADLDSCANPKRVAQHHARLLRLGFLHSLSCAFHWNCLMRGYLRHSLSPAALRLYLLMCRAGTSPDCYTVPIVLKATTHLFAPCLGKQLHCSAMKRGLELNEFCHSGLISLYSKLGEFDRARELFERNPHRRLGSWNALISGLAQGGRASDAIKVFLQLRRSGLLPDDVTMLSVASATGSVGDLDVAQQVHACVLKSRLRTNEAATPLLLQNSLIDMYGKCGRPDLAKAVFSRMCWRDVSSWTSMIMALALHGCAREAVDLFRGMISDGARPNHVTFVAVLSACAHGGMVEEGMGFFERMEGEFGVEPGAAHYGCVVDLLGRVGRVVKAREVIQGVAAAENCVVLGTLLGACEKHHGFVEVAEWAAARLAALEPDNDGAYVVLSNIYAANGLWDEVARLRRLMRDRSMAKVPAYSLASHLL